MDYTVRTLKGKREKLEVIIYTQTHKIVGTVHTMPASRLVDFMNSKTADLFIVVTNANVYELPEEKLLQAADFFVINKTTIMMVFPKSPAAPVISDGQSNQIEH